MLICCIFTFIYCYDSKCILTLEFQLAKLFCLWYAWATLQSLMPFPMYTRFFSFFHPSNRHIDKVVNVLPRKLTHWSLRTWHSCWLAKLGLWPPNTSLESFGTAIINYWKQKKKWCSFSDEAETTTRRYFNLPKGSSCNSQTLSEYLSSAVPSKLYTSAAPYPAVWADR